MATVVRKKAAPTASNAPAKPAAAPAPAPAPVKATANSKHRPRLVRDSFTMPEADFALVAVLKSRAMTAQRHARKSELLRAGLQALGALSPAMLVKALDRLEPVKTGRPKK